MLKYILISIITMTLGSVNITANDANEVKFIEAIFEVSYEEAVEFDKALTEEMSQESIGTTTSYDSEVMIKNAEENFGELVEQTYLEKLLINGDLFELSFQSLSQEVDYSIEDLELVEEEKEGNLVKQRWTFKQLMYNTKGELIETRQVEILLHTQDKIEYFKVLKNEIIEE